MRKRTVKYKNGLVLGKFYPPHKGHLHLIDTAISNSEKVHVMVCYNHTQSIPGKVRADVLKKIYKNNPNVNIHLAYDEGLPQHEHEVDSKKVFYGFWVPFVYGFIKELDVVFTSESYGDDFAEYLGIDHFLVDKERSKYTISATEIRKNPYDNWDYIPDEMKHYFIKRIAIMGPESVGKSILSEKLATHFNTNFVEEYGRTVYEENGNKINLEDFIKISFGRQDIEDRLIKESNKFIFCDTEDITTYLFSKMYFPDTYVKIEPFFETILRRKPNYDLYILLKPDTEWIQDGTRVFGEDRDKHYNVIKNFLIKKDCHFIEIDGNWEERFEKAKQLIYNFNI